MVSAKHNIAPVVRRTTRFMLASLSPDRFARARKSSVFWPANRFQRSRPPRRSNNRSGERSALVPCARDQPKTMRYRWPGERLPGPPYDIVMDPGTVRWQAESRHPFEQMDVEIDQGHGY